MRYIHLSNMYRSSHTDGQITLTLRAAQSIETAIRRHLMGGAQHECKDYILMLTYVTIAAGYKLPFLFDIINILCNAVG